jgi:hypothetical protein
MPFISPANTFGHNLSIVLAMAAGMVAAAWFLTSAYTPRAVPVQGPVGAYCEGSLRYQPIHPGHLERDRAIDPTCPDFAD